jgi:hypothetical protein
MIALRRGFSDYLWKDPTPHAHGGMARDVLSGASRDARATATAQTTALSDAQGGPKVEQWEWVAETVGVGGGR